MELKVNEIQLPDVIQFNYEELKQELTEKVKIYETMVYSDEQIKEAKADRANLNKLKKALNDERIRREKEYMQPFNEFKEKVNEIISIIDKPVALIDKQVKDFEEKKKADKRIEIGQIWESLEGRPEWLRLPQIFNEGWLKSSCSLKQVKEELEEVLEHIEADLQTLSGLSEFSFEAIDEYKRTLDINKAIAEGQRLADIQKRKEEAKEAEDEKKFDAKEKLAEGSGDEGIWITFEAKLNVYQAIELRSFFTTRGIEFKSY